MNPALRIRVRWKSKLFSWVPRLCTQYVGRCCGYTGAYRIDPRHSSKHLFFLILFLAHTRACVCWVSSARVSLCLGTARAGGDRPVWIRRLRLGTGEVLRRGPLRGGRGDLQMRQGNYLQQRLYTCGESAIAYNSGGHCVRARAYLHNYVFAIGEGSAVCRCV